MRMNGIDVSKSHDAWVEDSAETAAHANSRERIGVERE